VELATVDKILDFAIEKEQEAADLYTELAGKMDRPAMKQVFIGFAGEEQAHKARLVEIKRGKLMVTAERKVADMKIGDHLVDTGMNANMSYQEALIFAMKAEKASFKLYSDLAAATDNAGARSILLTLANEEAKHKLRFELEYDEVILKEN
jgi:rubrerythrin